MSDLIKQIRNNQEQLTNFFTSINKIVSTNDSGNFEIFENISKYFKICRNISKYFEIF